MPRTYVRKTDRGAKYTKEKLLEAVRAVKNGDLSAYAASKLYDIPRPTIVNRVYDRKGLKSNTLGRNTVLSRDVEEMLVKNLHTMEKYGFGMTRKEILETVGQYVTQNQIKNPFKNGIPGEDWFLLFKKRHNLSVKKPQPVEYARKKACCPEIIYPYFDLLEKTINDLDLLDKPRQIYNVDETSFSKDPKKTKVVGLRGFTSTRTISSPGKDNTTVLLGCNAFGEKLPPLIVYKGKNVWNTWTTKEDYPGTVYAATENGWMEAPIFEKFFEKVFLPTVGKTRPILLIYDGHSTHVGLNIIQKARDNDITILKIPPHTSDVLQPLDLAVNKSFKDKWDVELVKWQRTNIGKVLPKYDFSKIIGQVWSKVDPKVCAAGFCKAGIFPLNKNVVPESKFDQVLLSSWKSKLQERAASDGQLHQPAASGSDFVLPTVNHLQTDHLEDSELTRAPCAASYEPETSSTNHAQSAGQAHCTLPKTSVSKLAHAAIRKFESTHYQHKPAVFQPRTLSRLVMVTLTKIMYNETPVSSKVDFAAENCQRSLHEMSNCYKSMETQSLLEKSLPKQIYIPLEKTLVTPVSQIHQIPLKHLKTNPHQKIQILDDQVVQSNTTFEELLLKSVKVGTFIKRKRKKIASGAEVITHDEVYNRCKIQEAEKLQKLKTRQEKKKVPKETKSGKKKKTSETLKIKKRPSIYSSESEVDSDKVHKRCQLAKGEYSQKKRTQKDEKNFRKKKITKRPSISTSESEIDMIFDDESDLDYENLIENILLSDKENSNINMMSENEDVEANCSKIIFTTNDWVLVKFATKKTIKHYVGIVTDTVQNCPVVKYARKVASKVKGHTIFTFPNIDDVSEVRHVEDIVAKLPQPIIGRRGQISFNEMNFKTYNIQ